MLLSVNFFLDQFEFKFQIRVKWLRLLVEANMMPCSGGNAESGVRSITTQSRRIWIEIVFVFIQKLKFNFLNWIEYFYTLSIPV
jgi:hypothetical protein